MKDYLNIGCTPYDEPCAQVGSENYNKLSTIECRAFTHQCERALAKKFGEEYTVIVRIKSFPHDFGTYKEVVVEYDENNDKEHAQALYLEGEADLTNWDDEAKQELEEAGYTLHICL